jgi:hypothetical protein
MTGGFRVRHRDGGDTHGRPTGPVDDATSPALAPAERTMLCEAPQRKEFCWLAGCLGGQPGASHRAPASSWAKIRWSASSRGHRHIILPRFSACLSNPNPSRSREMTNTGGPRCDSSARTRHARRGCDHARGRWRRHRLQGPDRPDHSRPARARGAPDDRPRDPRPFQRGHPGDGGARRRLPARRGGGPARPTPDRVLLSRPRSPRRTRDVTAQEPWWPCPTAGRALRGGAGWSVGVWS